MNWKVCVNLRFKKRYNLNINIFTSISLESLESFLKNGRRSFSWRYNYVLIFFLYACIAGPILFTLMYLASCDLHLLAQVLPICRAKTKSEREGLISISWRHNCNYLVPLFTGLQFLLSTVACSSTVLIVSMVTIYPGICVGLIKKINDGEEVRPFSTIVVVSIHQGFAIVTSWVNQLLRNVITPMITGIVILQSSGCLYYFIKLHDSSILVSTLICNVLALDGIIIYYLARDLTGVPGITKSLVRRETCKSTRASPECKMLKSLRQQGLYCGNLGVINKHSYIMVILFILDTVVSLVLFEANAR